MKGEGARGKHGGAKRRRRRSSRKAWGGSCRKSGGGNRVRVSRSRGRGRQWGKASGYLEMLRFSFSC